MQLATKIYLILPQSSSKKWYLKLD